MSPPKSAARPPASLTSPKTGANKRQRKAASAVPLGDITNLLVLAESPTPSKPRRTARRALPATSDVSAVSSTCSSSASVTPAPKPSSAAVFEEEHSVVKSPTISTVHRRTTGAQERCRRNPASANNKGKEPVAATASCPPLGKSARTHSRWDYFTCLVPVHVICAGLHSERISFTELYNFADLSGKRILGPSPHQFPVMKVESHKLLIYHVKRPIASTPNLLEDLLEKQRAYFADIDAFELVEEEVSESELE
ncbi:hypothetical protein Zm00014a_005525 [Zea mays]|uniref:Sororin C-terminal region domain-containing protein n=1 Tax=Zea mays TaxID=4577 RepID=A0A3L6GD41_MAIZE|nr:hypothetical protein Zm00014a_005525 [Zea mays]